MEAMLSSGCARLVVDGIDPDDVRFGQLIALAAGLALVVAGELPWLAGGNLFT